jgi:hypothetical protein
MQRRRSPKGGAIRTIGDFAAANYHHCFWSTASVVVLCVACGSETADGVNGPAAGSPSWPGGSSPVGGAAGAKNEGAAGNTSGVGNTSAGAGTGATGGTTMGPGGSAGSGPLAGATIVNDRFWLDTAGTPIYSQGGGVLQVGDTYYWYGVKYRGAVSYAANPDRKNGDIAFEGITTYSSKDLVSWKLEATDKPQNTGGWFGRLGVAYHAATKKYVLAAQGGGGLYFATSDRPNGGFVFDNVQTDLPGIVNGSTGDQTIFQDDDGQAYLISSSSSGRANRYVSPLRASDFLKAEEAWFVYKGGGREGNCMFKHAGTYYHCSSDLHGWNTSQTYCVSATDLKGPWNAEFVMAGTAADYSHVTQTGFFISVKGSEQTTVIYAGDRWANFAGNGIGFNQWLPLSFENGEPLFHSLSAWTLDVAKGTWQVAKQNNYALNPSFEADRVKVTKPVGWQATGGGNVEDGYTGRWSWQLTGSASLAQDIPALPNGTYALSVWVKSSAAGANLYITDQGGTMMSAPVPAADTWTEVKVGGIAVTSGKAEIGVTSSSATVKVDDFMLVAE